MITNQGGIKVTEIRSELEQLLRKLKVEQRMSEEAWDQHVQDLALSEVRKHTMK